MGWFINKWGLFIIWERVQAIIIQNRSVIFGYGCIDKTKKEFRHFFIVSRVEEGETPGDQKSVLESNPEEVDINKELRTLHELQFVSLNNRDELTGIKIEYFRPLTNECKYRGYYSEWCSILLQLII